MKNKQMTEKNASLKRKDLIWKIERKKTSQITEKYASLLFYLFYITVSTGLFKGTVA